MTRTNDDRTGDGTRRFSGVEAAGILGISTEATRQRIKRGTLPTERDADGNVFVLLEADGTRTISDGIHTNADGTHTNADRTGDSTALFERMSGEIDYLRQQLEVWQEEARRKDHIIAALTERIPELEPASEPRESDISASEEQGNGADSSNDRSWFRRFFGL